MHLGHCLNYRFLPLTYHWAKFPYGRMVRLTYKQVCCAGLLFDSWVFFTCMCTQFSMRSWFLIPFPWWMTNYCNKTEQSLHFISGFTSDMLRKFTQVTHSFYGQGPSVVNRRLLVSPDHIQGTLKSAQESSYRQGKVLSLLLLFLTNKAAELEDLRSPHGLHCGLQNLRFNFKRIKFPVCFPGVTVRTYADRLLSSEAKSRHTKTMPQLERGWPFPIHLNGVLNLKPN